MNPKEFVLLSSLSRVYTGVSPFSSHKVMQLLAEIHLGAGKGSRTSVEELQMAHGTS